MRTIRRRPVLPRAALRPHPLSELHHLWRELDRWVAAPDTTRARSRLGAEATVVHDAEAAVWTLSAPLPGRRADQLEITIEGGRLTVKSAPLEVDDRGFAPAHVERSNRPVHLRWTLPEDADLDAVRASLTDGWLRVEVRRKPRPAPRTISVVTR